MKTDCENMAPLFNGKSKTNEFRLNVIGVFFFREMFLPRPLMKKEHNELIYAFCFSWLFILSFGDLSDRIYAKTPAEKQTLPQLGRKAIMKYISKCLKNVSLVISFTLPYTNFSYANVNDVNMNEDIGASADLRTTAKYRYVAMWKPDTRLL